MISATDIDPSPGVPHANGAAYRGSSTQVKTPQRPTSMPVTPHENRRSPALGALAARTARGAERSKPAHGIKTVVAPTLLDGAHAPTDAELPKTTRSLVARQALSRVTIARDRTGVVLRQHFRRVALRIRDPTASSTNPSYPSNALGAAAELVIEHHGQEALAVPLAANGFAVAANSSDDIESPVPLYQTSVPFTSVLFST